MWSGKGSLNSERNLRFLRRCSLPREVQFSRAMALRNSDGMDPVAQVSHMREVSVPTSKLARNIA